MKLCPTIYCTEFHGEIQCISEFTLYFNAPITFYRIQPFSFYSNNPVQKCLLISGLIRINYIFPNTIQCH